QTHPSNSFNQFTQPISSASVFGSQSLNQSPQPQQPQQPQQSFFASFGQPFSQQQSAGSLSRAPEASSSDMLDMPSEQASQSVAEATKTFGNLGQSSFGDQPNPPLSPKDTSMSLTPPESDTSMADTKERTDSLATVLGVPAPSTFKSTNLFQTPSAQSPAPSSSINSTGSALPPYFLPPSSINSGPAWSSKSSFMGQRTPMSMFSQSSGGTVQHSAQSGGFLPFSTSTPKAKTVNKALEATSSSVQKSSTKQQMETLVPPTCPNNFNEIQKQEYVTHYRIRSLNHAFKKHIDSALTFPVEAEVLGFYQAKMEQILLNGSLSVQKSGIKRKWLGDVDDDNGNGLSKRVITNGTLTNGDSSLATSSNINKSKRKADEDISKGSDGDGSSDTTKKARGDLNYPTLPQSSETARLFAQTANGNASSSASAPTANGIDSSQSSTVGSQVIASKSSMFGSSIGNNNSSSFLSMAKAAPTSNAGGAQSLFQFKPSTANKTAPANEQTLSFGSNVSPTITQESSAAPGNLSGGPFANTAGLTGSSNAVSGNGQAGNPASSTQPSTFKVPSFGAPSGSSFLSQFGQNAKKTEEQAKAKRKADEYDSEDGEDEEEAWERKYEDEQRAKKQKIEEAKANTTFKFVPNKASSNNNKDAESALASRQPQPAASSSSNTFGSGSVLQTRPETHSANPWAHLQAEGNHETHGDDQSESSDEDEPEATVRNIEAALASDASSAPAPRSLFDRIETNSDGSLKREIPAPSINERKEAPQSRGLFGQPSSFPPTSFSTTTAPRSGLFGQPFPKSQTTALFGSSSDTSPNTKVASGSPQLNNTWPTGSPIKFGSASTAPSLSFTSPTPTKATEKEQNSSSFSTLFGAKPAISSFGGQSTTFGASSSSTPSTNSASIFAIAPKASPAVQTVGFQFGGPPKPFGSLAAPSPFNSAASSRATSPGISTGGESAVEGDEEDGPPDAQIDLASARRGEEDEECLLEVKAKSLELGSITPKDEPQNNVSQEKKWIKRGLGPLRILKNRSTGKVRIVHRVETVGKIILNAALMQGMTYKHATDKTVTFGVATGAGNIAQWTIMVGSKEKAAELASLLEGNKSN
ncbi:hypothetical protein MMC18_009164, partial [Xylographa bjoerkii]|nr:hypothetical protein [Xylographa bjoerkii]